MCTPPTMTTQQVCVRVFACVCLYGVCVHACVGQCRRYTLRGSERDTCFVCIGVYVYVCVCMCVRTSCVASSHIPQSGCRICTCACNTYVNIYIHTNEYLYTYTYLRVHASLLLARMRVSQHSTTCTLPKLVDFCCSRALLFSLVKMCV